MPLKSENLIYLIGSEKILKNMSNLSVFGIFSNQVCLFLNELAKMLLQMPEAKQYSDVVTFAFWCRKANISQMAKMYTKKEIRLGRGIVFHVAPSNIAVNFAYSFVAALLAGNASIVRIPSTAFRQIDLICAAIKNVLTKYEEMIPYLCFVRYGHDKQINDCLSALCNTRVIWGGDKTIDLIRTSPLKPRATEITFADRVSIAVIDADQYLLEKDKQKLAEAFYNDTYLNDQNACTAPCILVWLGNNSSMAQEEFWQRLREIVEFRYSLQPVQVIDKLSAFYLLADTDYEVSKGKSPNNFIFRIQVGKIDGNLFNYKCNSGFFIEYKAKELAEILPLCILRCQTVAYYGLMWESIEDFIRKYRPAGIDRVVEIGKTMDFSLIWDGHDLIREMSRTVELKHI